jgi:hypothetical protein
LVVDEAAMVGTRSIARLLEHTEAAQGKLVLVGDYRQLPELEAGGLFRALAERTHPIELSEVRRQLHALDRENVERIRQGRGGEAFELYHSEDRVVIAPDAEARREAMVADWWRAVGEGREAIMIAKRNGDVAELNGGARELLLAAGALGAREVEVAGQRFAEGDIVVTRVNSTRDGVANRMRWEVREVDPNGVIELERLSDRQRVRLERDYLDRVNPQSGAPALEHGYAGTIYLAQGQSVEEAFVCAEASMSLEEFNTALSRSVGETHIYAVAEPEIERQEYAPREPRARDPFDEVLEAIERPEAQTAAVDEALAAPMRRLSTPELVGRRRGLEVDDETLIERMVAEATGDRAIGVTSEDAAAEAEIAAIDAVLAERRRLAIAAARISPPDYVRSAIGERPQDPADRHRWERALQEIESYRQTHGVRDRHKTLGREPGSGFEQAAYERAHGTIAEVQRELGRPELAHELEYSLEISV